MGFPDKVDNQNQQTIRCRTDVVDKNKVIDMYIILLKYLLRHKEHTPENIMNYNAVYLIKLIIYQIHKGM